MSGYWKICKECRSHAIKRRKDTERRSLLHMSKHGSTLRIREIAKQWYNKIFSYICRRCGGKILNTTQLWNEVTCKKGCRVDVDFYVENKINI